MVDHPAVIERFYAAFSRRDAETMAACYADDVQFSDPVFPDLHGDEARAMWRMLCARGKDLRVTATGIEANGDSGMARWQARYTFGKTGRPVHNVVTARFELRDGLITRHRDDFSMWRWSRQALGLPGLLLGWSPVVAGKVRAQADAQLRAFLAG